MTLSEQRERWRRNKAAQAARDPDGLKAKRRAHYQANADRIRERARRYYREVWKLKSAGVIP